MFKSDGKRARKRQEGNKEAASLCLPSITSSMYQTMADAIKDGEADPAVLVILFCGKPEVFSAGNDLEDFMNTKEDLEERPVAQFLRNLSGAAKPVIAAVSGIAIGIGVTMLLHCDQIYAAEHTKFSMPFTKLGLCPEFGSSKSLPEIIGYPRAAELLFFGESFLAGQALEMGLVNKVLPTADLLPYAYAQAAKLVMLPASALRTTKRLMKARHTESIVTRCLRKTFISTPCCSRRKPGRHLLPSLNAVNRKLWLAEG